MHELSLVGHLIRQVESILLDEGGGRATEIEVAIGPLSGVEPMLVQSAFEQLAPRTSLSHAALRIEETELRARCRQCHEEFVVESFQFQCPACESRSVDVTSGEDFRLVSISVEEEASPEPAPLEENTVIDS